MVVAVDRRAVAKGTPGWMLPTATIFAVLVSAASAYAIAESGKQPLSSSENAAFVAGCDRSPGGRFIDCGCVLNRLEADGYVTLNSLRGLVIQGQSEQLSGHPGAAYRTMIDAGLGCRR
jgi:hypothetical protein